MATGEGFGGKLKELRVAAGLSQRRLAGTIGVTPSYLSKLEKGVAAPPSGRLIRKISAALEVDSDELTILAGRLPGDIARILKDNSRASFGVMVREKRIKRGLSQAELAARAGISHTYLSKIENGAKLPPAEKVIIKIAGALRINSEELFHAAGKMSYDTISKLKSGKALRKLRAGSGRQEVAAPDIKYAFFNVLRGVRILPELVIHNQAARLVLATILVAVIGLFIWFASPTTESAVAANNRGLLHNENGEYQTAIEIFNDALEIDPELAPAYNNRAWAYIMLGDYELAVADCDKAIEIDAFLADAYNNRGLAELYMGRYEAALADCSEAIKIDSEIATAYNNRGWAYFELGQYELAVADCTTAIELDSGIAFAYSNRGKAYIELGQYEKAVADFDKAMELDPELQK